MNTIVEQRAHIKSVLEESTRFVQEIYHGEYISEFDYLCKLTDVFINIILDQDIW